MRKQIHTLTESSKDKEIILKDKDGKIVKVGDIIFMSRFHSGKGENVEITEIQPTIVRYRFIDRKDENSKGWADMSLFKKELKFSSHSDTEKYDDFEDKTTDMW